MTDSVQPGLLVEAIDLNPMHWLGDTAAAAAADAWTAAMTGLWSAALWLLKLAFTIIDAFTTPDLSAGGPMAAVLPTTLWLAATLAVIMMFVQLTVALVRRDGQSIARLLLGVAQFGLAWVGSLGVEAGLVTAASGLERGILHAMLHVDALSAFDVSRNWPHQITDATLATVLGVLSLLLVIPAAFFYLLIMLVREAALIVLAATSPISAAGLLSDVGRAWFWKSLRWFVACLLIAPLAALLLGVGVQLSAGVITTPGTDAGASVAHAGMAVIGCIVIVIGAVCPLVLFRLLAFVEPGTASGAALRQSWADVGGLPGLAGGARHASGSSAARHSDGLGRSAGEFGAESATQSRLAAALGPALTPVLGPAIGAAGAGLRIATAVAHRATDIGSDILGQAGVGAAGYSMTPTDERSSRRGGVGAGRASGGGGATSGGEADSPPAPGPPSPSAPPPSPSSPPPLPPSPPSPEPPSSGGAPGPLGGGRLAAGGSGGATTGETRTAAVVPG